MKKYKLVVSLICFSSFAFGQGNLTPTEKQIVEEAKKQMAKDSGKKASENLQKRMQSEVGDLPTEVSKKKTDKK